MIIFDTETTGLPKAKNDPIENHPEIIEFGAIRVDDETLEEVDRLEFLCKPKIASLPDKIVKITGITDGMLVDKNPFKAHYNDLCRFFIGEKYLLAHNCPFDVYMMWCELTRLDKLTKFPWPPVHICTVEKTMFIDGKRQSLDKLVKKYLGRDVRKGSHRAIVDVEDLLEVVKCLRAGNVL